MQTFVTPVEKDLANPRLEAARLKHAWAAMVAQEATSSTLSMDPVDEDELLPADSSSTRKAIATILPSVHLVAAFLDCSTKSRIRQIPAPGHRPCPAPLRSEREPRGLAGLSDASLARVEADNHAADFLLAIQFVLQQQPGGHAGDRRSWLELPAAVFRSEAMTPLALFLGLFPPGSQARLPRRAVAADVLANGKLPQNMLYVGQGHFSHRLHKVEVPFPSRSPWGTSRDCFPLPGVHAGLGAPAAVA